MSNLNHRLACALFGLLSVSFASVAAESKPKAVLPANDPLALWQDVDATAIAARGERWVQPQIARTIALDFNAVQSHLARAPMEGTVAARASAVTFSLPMPDGGFAEFAMVESPVMAPELMAKYPSIRTYAGQGLHDPSATLRLDVTPIGFHAQVLSPAGDFYIDPYQKSDNEHYLSYFRKHHVDTHKNYKCETHGEDLMLSLPADLPAAQRNPSGASLRTYRIAVAASASYTNAFGGTVGAGLSGVVTMVNRISGIYEREFTVRLNLVANEDLLIYTNGNLGPIPNPPTGPDTIIQTTIDNVIGFANYDIGHAVGGSGGGGAITPLGNVCGTQKSRGFTSFDTPNGDVFDIDFVAHELGHQLGGSHTWNGCGGGGQWTATSAMEPGSGSTIMAYAGICPDDLQPNSDAYFHARSFTQIFQNINNGGSGNGNVTCGTVTATGNTPPNVTAPANFTIPERTPFQLTAVNGGDPDVGDSVTYNWEQVDTGAQGSQSTTGDNGTAPLFRSFNASLSPTRIFPSLQYILDNANVPPAQIPWVPASGAAPFFSSEILPNPAQSPPGTARVMNFRVTARDNRVGFGGLRHAEMAVTATSVAGPFIVDNIAGPLTGGATQAITWQVANTVVAPVLTTNVNILISHDGGYTFSTLLANTLNDGAESVTIPNVATSRARIKIEAANGTGISAGNTWFDITDSNFAITATGNAVTVTTIGFISTQQGSPAPAPVNVATIAGGDAPYTATADFYPSNPDLSMQNVTVVGTTVSASAAASCALAAPNEPSYRIYPAVLKITDAANPARTASSVIPVQVANNEIPAIGTYTNQIVARGNSVNVSPSAAPTDGNGNFTAVSVSPTTLPGGGTVTVNPVTGQVTITATAGTTLGSHTISVSAKDTCGAAGVQTFTVNVTTVDPVLQLNGNVVTSGNAIIEPNECNTMNVTLGNVGGSSATSVNGTLSSSTPGVTISGPTSAYPDIASAATGTNSGAFEISTAPSVVCGSTINLTETVTYAGVGSPSVFNFSVLVGQPAASNYTIATSEGAAAVPGATLVTGSQDDDTTLAVTNFPAGFAFSVYGTPVTQLRVDTNGILGFNASSGTSSAGNGALPAGIFTTPSLVAFWDDLDGSAAATTGGGIYTAVSGVAPNRIFDVEWRMTRYRTGATPTAPTVVFTARLHETTNLIEVIYTNVTGNTGQGGGTGVNGSSATIGIQAASTGTQFTQFSNNTASLAAGRKLSFTRLAGLCNPGPNECGVTPDDVFEDGFE